MAFQALIQRFRASSQPIQAFWPYISPLRPEFSPNGRTNERTNESPPVFYRTSSPSGPLPCFSLQFTITQSRATGIADHILPLCDLFIIIGIMSNPLHMYWRPSTFGGQIGLDIINSASLKKLFCDNLWKNGIKEECPHIAFHVPGAPPLARSSYDEL